jgi:hypothetical protein
MKTDHPEEEGDKNKNKPTSKPANQQPTNSQPTANQPANQQTSKPPQARE